MTVILGYFLIIVSDGLRPAVAHRSFFHTSFHQTLKQLTQLWKIID
ncbi:hypothetical protein IQ259_13875 [Fortiea sp. LEGE XX443]|nr:hypothetical protein [Fortiea sp. LEGE XX443]